MSYVGVRWRCARRVLLGGAVVALGCGDHLTEPPFLGCDGVVPLVIGTTQSGALFVTDCRVNGKPVDYYALRVDTLTTLRLYLSSSRFEARLTVWATAPAVPIVQADGHGMGGDTYLGQGLEPGAYVVAVQGAGEEDLGPYSLRSEARAPAAPTLITPPPGYVVYQYADAPFCDRQYGFEIHYEWTSVPGAAGYHLLAIGANALGPAVSKYLSDTAFTDTSCESWVDGPHLTAWTWWVGASMPDGTWLVSAPRHYDFTEPYRP